MIMKKRNFFSSIWLCAAACIILSSCSRNEDALPTANDLLTKTPWKLVKDEQRKNQGPWTSNNVWLPCELDDLLVFKTDGQYEFNEGAVKCSPNDPHIIEFGKWALVNNNTEIKFNKDNGPVTANEKIEKLDETTLVLVDQEINGNDIYNTRFTYSH
jgi:hypothetical protein